jgi:hypothetical protein
MTIHEVTALVLLYRACQDEDLQRRVLRLVPDLAELVDQPTFTATHTRPSKIDVENMVRLIFEPK